MDMREKIARAIYESRNGAGCKPWAHITGDHRKHYLVDATAALTALEEPTPEMVEAAQWKAEDEGFLDFDPGDFSMAFSAAIRAAKGGSDD